MPAVSPIHAHANKWPTIARFVAHVQRMVQYRHSNGRQGNDGDGCDVSPLHPAYNLPLLDYSCCCNCAARSGGGSWSAVSFCVASEISWMDAAVKCVGGAEPRSVCQGDVQGCVRSPEPPRTSSVARSLCVTHSLSRLLSGSADRRRAGRCVSCRASAVPPRSCGL